jgi:hypothetical protein
VHCWSGAVLSTSVDVMRVLASALLALAAAAAIAQLGQPPISWVALLPTGSAGHAATPRAVLEAPVTVMKAIWWSMGSGQKGTQVQRAPAVGAGLGAPVARTPGTPDYHEPLVTYHLSAADLQLHDASPAQWPATHVVQLPLSSLAPLTSATYMPSEVAALSSQGYKTYMVRTVEFFQVSTLKPCPSCEYPTLHPVKRHPLVAEPLPAAAAHAQVAFLPTSSPMAYVLCGSQLNHIYQPCLATPHVAGLLRICVHCSELPPPSLPPSLLTYLPTLKQNQAAIHSMLAAWDAAGWVDPYTGVVTQPGALAMCGDTLARRRGYGRAAVAAQAAAAHRWAA